MPLSLFDATWAAPTELQLAALRHVYRCFGQPNALVTPDGVNGVMHALLQNIDLAGNPIAPDNPLKQITPYQLAHMLMEPAVLLAQAQSWAAGQTPYRADLGQALVPVFTLAGETLAYLLAQPGEWWAKADCWPAPESATRLVAVLEAARNLLIMQVRNGREFYPLGLYWLPRLLLPEFDVFAANKMLADGPDSASALVTLLIARFDPQFAKALKRDVRQSRIRHRKPNKKAVQ